MTEDSFNKFRHQDMNLSEALCQEEMELPELPSDLNARVMQQVAKQNAARKRKRIVWPWVAAACVAALIVVFLTPPKTKVDEGGKRIVEATKDSVKQKSAQPNSLQPKIVEEKKAIEESLLAQTEQKTTKKERKSQADSRSEESANPQVTQPVEQTMSEQTDKVETYVAEAKETRSESQPRILSESDIPITRPENYKHTSEELALMKQQANEAYLKWVELELEISKYNLEKTAQK